MPQHKFATYNVPKLMRDQAINRCNPSPSRKTAIFDATPSRPHSLPLTENRNNFIIDYASVVAYRLRYRIRDPDDTPRDRAATRPSWVQAV